MRGRSARLAVGAALLAIVAAAPATGAAPARIEHLQHLGTKSYFAFVNHATVARKTPDANAAEVAKVTTRSPVGTDDLLLVLAYLAQLYDPLKTISRKAGGLQSYLASAERAFALLDRPPEVEGHEVEGAGAVGRRGGHRLGEGLAFAAGDSDDVVSAAISRA